MTKVKGRFYFKQTSNGNLLGEFSNSGPQSWTESADATGSTTGCFIGSYQSSWQENGTPLFAELTITAKASCHNLFSLEWKRGGTLIFKGEAMLCEDILVGDYQSGRADGVRPLDASSNTNTITEAAITHPPST